MFPFRILFAVAAISLAVCNTPVYARDAVPLDEFADVIKHYRDQHPDDQAALYTPDNVSGIADNLLLYQRANGGWPVNRNPLRVLSEAEKISVRAAYSQVDTSLDNRNTYPQIRYLARAWQQTGDTRYREAARRGIEFLLASQTATGGWTHSPPRNDSYYGHITLADEVMTGVLTLLRDIAAGDTNYDFVPDALRQQVTSAWRQGEQLLLDLQIRVDGRRTAWVGQYDSERLVPAAGRSYELPGLVSWESVAVVRYLMANPVPDSETIAAIEAAIAWFTSVRLEGVRLEYPEIDPVRHSHHTATRDVQIVNDSEASSLWARFYEIGSNRPFMANRDGTKVYRLIDVLPDRRTGYDWYGDWPQTLLEQDYPAWQLRIESLHTETEQH